MCVVGSGVFVFRRRGDSLRKQSWARCPNWTTCLFMAKDFALSFYASGVWKATRSAYRKHAGGMCERCLVQPGEIVHHKTPLSPQNINDPSIALSFDNLELLCRDCHGLAHGRQKRYKLDAFGHVSICQTSPRSSSRGGY